MTRCRSKDIADIVFFFFPFGHFARSCLSEREMKNIFLGFQDGHYLPSQRARAAAAAALAAARKPSSFKASFFFFLSSPHLGSRATGSFVAVVICFGRAFLFRSVLSSLKRDPLRERSRFLSYSREPRYYNPTTDGKNGVNSLAGFRRRKKKNTNGGAPRETTD